MLATVKAGNLLKSTKVKNVDFKQESKIKKLLKNGEMQKENVQSVNHKNTDTVNMVREKSKTSETKKSSAIGHSLESSSSGGSFDFANTLGQKLMKKNSFEKSSTISKARKMWKHAFATIKLNARMEMDEDDDEEIISEKNRVVEKDDNFDDLNRSERSLSTASINNLISSASSKGYMEKGKQTKSKFNDNNSYFRSAIPCLPLNLSILCLTLNFCIPGLGTVFSGIFVICFGEARLSSKDGGQKIMTLIVNIIVGICQLFTTILLLVGWFWSVAWGVYMVIISLEKKRLIKRLSSRRKQRQ